MRLSIIGLIALSTFYSTVWANPCELVVEEASLGVDPRDAFAVEVKIDIYRCTKNTGQSKNLPLIVFACGGSNPKADYNIFASGLARKGFVVVTLEHPLSFSSSGPPLNFANAVDVQNAIVYIENKSFLVDTTQIVLMGHSFGMSVVLDTLNEKCDLPLCQKHASLEPQGISVSRHPGIVLGAAFGSSLRSRSGAGGFSSLTNVDTPFGIINWAGDINTFIEIADENLTTGTFRRLNPTKVIATIANLDHFSISESNPRPNRPDILSTLPREQQIDIVVQTVAFWLKMNLKNKPTTSFCSQLNDEGIESGKFELVECLEEYQ